MLGNTFTNYFTNTTNVFDAGEYDDLVTDPWVATVYIDAATGQNFTSWGQFFGPTSYDGDNFTTIVSGDHFASVSH